jgi:hypothetical protein
MDAELGFQILLPKPILPAALFEQSYEQAILLTGEGIALNCPGLIFGVLNRVRRSGIIQGVARI